MKATPDEIRAAEHWATTPVSERTADRAKQALRDMGFAVGAGNADEQRQRADFWAARLIDIDAETVRIPRRFYDDHANRDLPTPPAIRETKRHVWIDPDHPDVPELVSDARYYDDPQGFDPEVARWIVPAARALLKVLEKERRDL